MLCLVFVLVGLFLLHSSVLLSTFKAYNAPYRTLYYDRGLIECAPIDYTNMDINISDTLGELAQIEGVHLFSKLSSLAVVRYNGVQINLVIIEDDYWQGYSGLKSGTGYSSSGLSKDGMLQAVLVDPFGLVKTDAPEFSFEDKNISVDITARFSSPYLFPNLEYYGKGSITQLFYCDKSYLILKKSDEVLKLLDSYGIPTSYLFTRFFFIGLPDNNVEIESKVNEVLVKNEYMTNNMKDNNMLTLNSIQGGSPDTLVLISYIVFLIVLLSLTFLIIFYNFTSDELSLLRLVGMKGSHAARLAFSSSMAPIIISFIVDVAFFLFFSSSGKLPLSSLSSGFEGKYFYSFPLYLLMLAVFAAVFLLLSALTLRLMYGKRSVLVLVKEMNV